MRERLELWGRALGQSLRQALQFDPDFFSFTKLDIGRQQKQCGKTSPP